MKKILFLVLYFLSSLPAKAQEESYLKALQSIENNTSLFCIPAQDKGWFVFSADSLLISKFSSCGRLQWKKKYSIGTFPYRGIDIIATKSGGFAFLVMNYPAANYHGSIVNADAMGNIIWSKSIEDAPFVEVPYTLIQDKLGNFFMYGNVTHSPTNEVYNSLTKILLNGNLSWRKLYNHGGIWGGAILTSDNGFLLRTGSKFIKTDANGNVSWTSNFQVGMYQYHKAVEVSDGYICNGYAHSSSGGDTISFFKLDKNGNMLWGGKKQVPFTGAPLRIKSKYNGNLIFMNGFQHAGKSYSTWTEFDKDLQVVNQSAVNSISFNSSFLPRDVCFLSDSSALISGILTVNDSGFFPHLAFLKTDKNQHFSCDTSFALTSTLQPLSQTFISTQTSDRNFNAQQLLVVSTSLQDSEFTLCSNYSPLELYLGTDTSLCEGSTLTIKNKSSDSFDRFTWSTGETTSEITVSQSGKYWLRAVNYCRNDSLTDTLEVNFPTFPKPNLIQDTSICSEKSILLNASIAQGTYLWQDGSTLASFETNEPGDYFVHISYLNCTKRFDIQLDDCEILLLPNVISPNSDGYNNNFIPIEMKGILEARIKIFNRWGQEIYYSTDIRNRPWNGYNYDKKCTDGIYYWVVEYTNYRHQQKMQKGSVSLFVNEP